MRTKLLLFVLLSIFLNNEKSFAQQIPFCDQDKTTVFVDASRPNNDGDGYSWATAKKSLWSGLNISLLCPNITRINVAEGVYKPTTLPDQKDENFFVRHLKFLYGGYPSGGGVRDHAMNPTIIDGAIDANNSVYHPLVVYAASSLIIDGFQIKGGNANGSGSTVLDISNNMERNKGGGIYMKHSDNVTIKNCIFYHNRANQDGGAIFASNSNPTFYNTIFYNNQANYGPAVYITGSENHTVNIYHSNFHSNNNTDGLGGALYNNGSTIINIANSILWGNYSPSIFDGAGDKIVTACILNEGNTDRYNHTVNPQYMNTANLKGADGLWFTADDGLQLCSGSPGINRGIEIAEPIVNKDITGNSRHFGRCDIGAYERQTVPVPEQLSADLDSVNANIFGENTGETALFVANSCKIIANIESGGSHPIRGMVRAKTYIDEGELAYNGMLLVNRHYEIHPTNNINAASARVSLFFNNSDFKKYNNSARAVDKLPEMTDLLTRPDKSKLRIVKYGGTSTTGQPGTYDGPTTIIDPTDEDITYSNGIWKISFEVENFSGFFVTASAATPLPINLLKFEGKNKGESIELKWQTANEKNFNHFEIERSMDAQKFMKVGELNGKNAESYEFEDRTPPQGAGGLYRLKMVDNDGEYSYSKTIFIKYHSVNESITIFPNPTQNMISVTGINHSSIEKIQIVNLLGQILQESNKSTINVENLRAGKYIIRILQNSGSIINKSFVKN